MTITLDSRAGASLAGEFRRQEFRSEIRTSTATRDDKEFLVLDGYASTVEQGYTMYDFFGPYTEIIDRGAFDATLAASPDVNFLINHSGLSMARTTAGTLELEADDHGLRSIAYLNPQRSDVQDLAHALRDGAVDEMSFMFRIEDGQWSPDYSEYRITKVNLDRGDVSAVNYGANPYTSISARAKQAFEAIEHLEGEPLRIVAARVQARLAEQARVVADGVTVDYGPRTIVVRGAVTTEPVKSGPNIRTLRARLEMGMA